MGFGLESKIESSRSVGEGNFGAFWVIKIVFKQEKNLIGSLGSDVYII